MGVIVREPYRKDDRHTLINISKLNNWRFKQNVNSVCTGFRCAGRVIIFRIQIQELT